jgi:toxin ParE1/3/4
VRLQTQPQGRRGHPRRFYVGASQFGIQQAERSHDLLERTFQFLTENPEAARQRGVITPPVRIHPIESHIVIYTVDERGDIFIVRVRHGREDWARDQ